MILIHHRTKIGGRYIYDWSVNDTSLRSALDEIWDALYDEPVEIWECEKINPLKIEGRNVSEDAARELLAMRVKRNTMLPDYLVEFIQTQCGVSAVDMNYVEAAE